MKTITGKELNAQIDRLVTEYRQLTRRIKALEDASCETENESTAFYTLIKSRFDSAADPEENKSFRRLQSARVVTGSRKAEAEKEVEIDSEPAPTESREEKADE